jgi:hypothetical protein
VRADVGAQPSDCRQFGNEHLGKAAADEQPVDIRQGASVSVFSGSTRRRPGARYRGLPGNRIRTTCRWRSQLHAVIAAGRGCREAALAGRGKCSAVAAGLQGVQIHLLAIRSAIASMRASA